jgi:hypothetical protein
LGRDGQRVGPQVERADSEFFLKKGLKKIKIPKRGAG